MKKKDRIDKGEVEKEEEKTGSKEDVELEEEDGKVKGLTDESAHERGIMSGVGGKGGGGG